MAARLSEETKQVFDVIIIGAGTAGCVLANRLSNRDPDISILLLEAGEDRSADDRVYTPGLSTTLLGDPELDWQYVAEPNAGVNGRSIRHPRGKVVGGSSAINSFALIYPSAAGMDAWADLGNEGWDWEGTKSYFSKFQTVYLPSEELRRELQIPPAKDIDDSTGGPIEASFPQRVMPLQKAWIETWQTLGLRNGDDPRYGRALGGYTSTCHITHERHERSHAGVAYLNPVRARKNLTLVSGALVTKIKFDVDQEGPVRASSVLYEKHGVIQEVRVAKEVILAAGAFASPQILELSGIGNAEILGKHGIDAVYANEGVGENLQDHIRPGISLESVDSLGPPLPPPSGETRKQYEKDRSGPLAENACFAFAYQPLVPFLQDDERQELNELLAKYCDSPSSEFERHHNKFIRAMVESPDEATATTYLARKPASNSSSGNFVSLFSMLSHPFSRGSAHIVSADVAVKPKLDFGYYSHPLDLEIHARHLQQLEKILRTEPMASLIKKDGRRLPPGYDVSSLEKAKELAMEFSSTNYHPCGTCSMMPEKMGGVVDDRLKVYGTRNVRVVDASIMPIIPRGNIITTVYAVAEKAADIISDDLGLKSLR